MQSSDSKPLVLLVDDEPLHLQWLGAVLQGEFDLREAETGRAALDLLKQGAKPQLVLLDVQLPDLSGHEVLKEMRGVAGIEYVPVIIMSADRSEQNEMAGFDLGADDFVAKPIDPRILKLRMRNLLQREDLRQETLRLGVAQSEQALATAEAELRATRGELEEAAKLQALGRLVASFAHDIGNPIGNSLLAISTLQSELSDLANKFQGNALTKQALERGFKVSQQGADMALRNLDSARQMLQSFKQQALDQATAQRREVDFAEWIPEVLFVLSPMWRKRRIEVRPEIDGALPVTTLPGPLTQVIGNLISNSIAHAFDDGDAGLIRLLAEGDEHSVALKVIDNGKGMTEAVAAKAFEPFFTTRAGRGGTGLGLDIVKQLVEKQLSGSLSFNTAVGRGTEFCIRLPRVLPALDEFDQGPDFGEAERNDAQSSTSKP